MHVIPPVLHQTLPAVQQCSVATVRTGNNPPIRPRVPRALTYQGGTCTQLSTAGLSPLPVNLTDLVSTVSFVLPICHESRHSSSLNYRISFPSVSLYCLLSFGCSTLTLTTSRFPVRRLSLRPTLTHPFPTQAACRLDWRHSCFTQSHHATSTQEEEG